MKTKKCIYCEDNNKSEHFLCDMCGVGMCEDCYQAGTEHNSHYNQVCENCDSVEYKAIVDKIGYEPDYLCEDCLGEILKSYNIPLKISEILEQTKEVTDLLGSDGIDEKGEPIFLWEFKIGKDKHKITFK